MDGYNIRSVYMLIGRFGSKTDVSDLDPDSGNGP